MHVPCTRPPGRIALIAHSKATPVNMVRTYHQIITDFTSRLKWYRSDDSEGRLHEKGQDY